MVRIILNLSKFSYISCILVQEATVARPAMLIKSVNLSDHADVNCSDSAIQAQPISLMVNWSIINCYQWANFIF